MSDWGSAISKWVNNDFIVYSDVNEIKDAKMYPDAYRRGALSVVFYRLTDGNGYWLGTLVIDFTREQPTGFTHLKGQACKLGRLIADILPEYNPPNKE